MSNHIDAIDDANDRLERMVRHSRAIASSDFAHLLFLMREAANLASDIAGICDEDATYKPSSILRGFSDRWKREIEYFDKRLGRDDGKPLQDGICTGFIPINY